VIDNDGVHAAVTATGAVTLAPRLHSIRLTYFQGPNYELALVLAVQPRKEKYRIFDMSEFVPAGEQLTEAESAELNKRDAEELKRQQLQETSTPDEREAVKQLAGDTLPHPFDFRTAVFGFRGEGEGTRNMLAFELPVSSLKEGFDPATKNHKFSFDVFAAVKDADGHIVQKFGLDFPYRVPDDKIAAFRSTSFTFTRPFSLAPGIYTLQTVVFDKEAKSYSASAIPIDRTGTGVPLTLSTPMLVEKVQPAKNPSDPADPFVVGSNRLVPQLKNVVPAAHPQVYFVVYPDKANHEPPTIKIAFLINGKQMAEQSANLPAPDANGAIPLTIAAAAQPGECELRITAIQGSESVSRTLSYTVAAADVQNQ